MAAGLGFKTFTTGEVLTAADTNGYLMQGINVFASTAARDAAITSPQEGQFAFTKDTNGLWYYDGAAWVASGATGDIEGVTAGIGISGGGTSGTVTVTNSMATAIDAKADLVVGTGADAFSRLAVGTDGQILTADSTVSPTGLKWATAAAGGGGFTLINRTSFSNVASTTTSFDGVFTSTYETYYVVVESIGCGSPYTDDMQLQMLYAGPTTQTTNYFAMSYGAKYDATALTFQGVTAGAQITLWNNVGGAGYLSQGVITITNVGNGSRRLLLSGYAVNGDGHYGPSNFAGICDDSRVYTGFLLKSSSTNITGTVAVYGLAKS